MKIYEQSLEDKIDEFIEMAKEFKRLVAKDKEGTSFFYSEREKKWQCVSCKHMCDDFPRVNYCPHCGVKVY